MAGIYCSFYTLAIGSSLKAINGAVTSIGFTYSLIN